MDPSFPLSPILNFLFAILALLLLPWRFRALSTAVRMYIAWIALSCICRAVNSIIWRDNVNDVAPVWCDISTRVLTGASVAYPACSFAIIRRLYHSTRFNKIAATRSEIRKEIITDMSLSLAFPLVVIALAYIVQARRYDIFEEAGCVPQFFNTAMLYVFVLMWPLVFGLLSSIYAAFIIRTLLIQRKELQEVLSSQSSRVSSSHFYRALALTLADALITVPLSILILYIDAGIQPVAPWPGWTQVHRDFSQVFTAPAIYWRGDPQYYLDWPGGIGWLRFYVAWCQWSSVVVAFVFVAIYGTTPDVVKYFVSAFRSVASVLGWKGEGKPREGAKGAGVPLEPMFSLMVNSQAGAASGSAWNSPSMLNVAGSTTHRPSLDIPESPHQTNGQASPDGTLSAHEHRSPTSAEAKEGKSKEAEVAVGYAESDRSIV